VEIRQALAAMIALSLYAFACTCRPSQEAESNCLISLNIHHKKNPASAAFLFGISDTKRRQSVIFANTAERQLLADTRPPWNYIPMAVIAAQPPPKTKTWISRCDRHLFISW
jgi:hypothetical protein